MVAASSTEEGKAATDLKRGSLFAVVGAVAALAVPVALLLFARAGVGGLSLSSSTDVETEGLLLVVGAVLVLLALFLYRRAFSHLRHVDRRLTAASVLCLVGSVGALALIAAGAYIGGGSSALTGCFTGHASHALSCLRSHDPAAGWIAIAGYWLLWLGAAGVALGLILSGRRFPRSAIVAGGSVYGVLVVILVLPFVALVVTAPLAAYALAVAPFAAVAAPILVYAGARATVPGKT